MPDILLPAAEMQAVKTGDTKKAAAMSKEPSAWAVVACDQYTQDRAYWEKAARIAEGKPSAMHIILPEIYLNELSQAEKEKAAVSIQNKMKDYLTGGVFAPPINGFIYVERTTAYGRLRKGLVAAIDLEEYEWKRVQRQKYVQPRQPLSRVSRRVLQSEKTPRLKYRILCFWSTIKSTRL